MASTTGNEMSALAALAGNIDHSRTTRTETNLSLSLAAEDDLRQISKSHFNELKSFAKPPLACLAIIEGVGILLDPSKTEWDWADDKKLMGGGLVDFLQRLFNVDKDRIDKEQLKRLGSILDRDDCQPAKLAAISALCHRLGSWLRAIVAYAKQREKLA